MADHDRHEDGEQPALSDDLERVRRKAAAKHAKSEARGREAEVHPLGPNWLWVLGLLGGGAVPALLLLLVLLGPPWGCRRAAAAGAMIACGGPGLFGLILAALGLEGLRDRVAELLEFQQYTERVPGVVTGAELVEKALSEGGYSCYVEFEVQYEASGRMRRTDERVSIPSMWAMKRLVRRHPAGTVIDVRYRPGRPSEPLVFGPGRLHVTWLAARALVAVFAGGLFGAALFAAVAAVVGVA